SGADVAVGRLRQVLYPRPGLVQCTARDIGQGPLPDEQDVRWPPVLTWRLIRHATPLFLLNGARARHPARSLRDRAGEVAHALRWSHGTAADTRARYAAIRSACRIVDRMPGGESCPRWVCAGS